MYRCAVRYAIQPNVHLEYVRGPRRRFERFGARAQNATGENRITANVRTYVDKQITFAQKVYCKRHLFEFAKPVIDVSRYPLQSWRSIENSTVNKRYKDRARSNA